MDPQHEAVQAEAAALAQPDESRLADAVLASLAVEGKTDEDFTEILIAATLFKNFLIGRGVDVSPEVLKGLGDLASAFQSEIQDYKSRHDFPPDSKAKKNG